MAMSYEPRRTSPTTRRVAVMREVRQEVEHQSPLLVAHHSRKVGHMVELTAWAAEAVVLRYCISRGSRYVRVLGLEIDRPRKLGAIHLVADDLLQRQDVAALFIVMSRHAFVTRHGQPDQVRRASAGSAVGDGNAGEESPHQCGKCCLVAQTVERVRAIFLEIAILSSLGVIMPLRVRLMVVCVPDTNL